MAKSLGEKEKICCIVYVSLFLSAFLKKTFLKIKGQNFHITNNFCQGHFWRFSVQKTIFTQQGFIFSVSYKMHQTKHFKTINKIQSRVARDCFCFLVICCSFWIHLKVYLLIWKFHVCFSNINLIGRTVWAEMNKGLVYRSFPVAGKNMVCDLDFCYWSTWGMKLVCKMLSAQVCIEEWAKIHYCEGDLPGPHLSRH